MVVAREGGGTEQDKENLEVFERADRQLEVDRKEVAWLRGPTIEPPFVAIGEDAPCEHLGFVEVFPNLAVGIPLLAFAHLRKRMPKLLGFQNAHTGAIALGNALVENAFFGLAIWVQDVIRL